MTLQLKYPDDTAGWEARRYDDRGQPAARWLVTNRPSPI
jgi:hypothetical protein